MKIILLGAPGVGKGTQAKLICKHYDMPHISTGDMFRAQISQGTSLGKQVVSYLQKGELVPDELTIAIVKERLSREDCSLGFLLDGFPRSLIQAKEMDSFLLSSRQYIDMVLLMDLPNQIILDRISGRRLCTKCGSNFHIIYNPSKLEHRCDHCGGVLIQRDDDAQEVVKDRLKNYHETIKPILDYYCAKGILYRIPANENDSIDMVFTSICNTIKQKNIIDHLLI